jgi:hypothetical protein
VALHAYCRSFVSLAPDRRTTTSRVSPTVEEKGSHDGGRARDELLRGIGFDSYDARRAVAACGELLQASAGRFDLARSCVFWCKRSADGIDPPSKVRNLTNRWSCRLKCILFRWNGGCCGSAGLIRRRNSTLCWAALTFGIGWESDSFFAQGMLPRVFGPLT